MSAQAMSTEGTYVVEFNYTEIGRDNSAEVTAHYYSFSANGEFIEFKDGQHGVVYAVQAACVLSIKRMASTSAAA